MNPTDTIFLKLQELRASFAAQLPEKIQEIETHWSAVLSGDTTAGTLKTLHLLAHKLTGSGATFGFSAVSAAARVLEEALQGILENGATPTTEYLDLVTQHVSMLKYAMTMPDKVNDIATTTPIQDSATAMADETANQLIFIIDDEEPFTRDLALKVSHSGYTVRFFLDLASFKEGMKHARPAAIIMDMMLPDGNGADAIAEMRDKDKLALPVIFLSANDDFQMRLKAIRCGGYAYFTKPMDINALVDTLDKATIHQKVKPYRVLVIDDSPSLAMLYSHTLKAVGMITETISDPMAIMDTLASFAPELILMDVYMPNCNGLELAAVLRQQEKYVSIPIVFLSGETDLDKQLDAMRLGGDDFLVKPIQPDHLISAVTTRTSRYRILRSLMKRDSLTGLYNHTTTTEYLNHALELARRRKASLVFAMIDIDRFKSVNDTYGHAAGDRVIKSLTRLLQQRLRKADIIGRYGGEEFAAVLVDADIDNAYKILEKIRVDFSQLHQECEGVAFTSTFSCGIAAFPTYDNPISLKDAADKAMYEAKHAGRNRVMIADPTSK